MISLPPPLSWGDDSVQEDHHSVHPIRSSVQDISLPLPSSYSIKYSSKIPTLIERCIWFHPSTPQVSIL